MTSHPPESHRPPRLERHFESLEKQEHAARLGMWIFLGSEVLLFAGLFALYTAYRSEYPAEFLVAFHHNDVAIGTTNTVILIVSSFTVAWAIHSLGHGRRRACLISLAVTMALGATFLVLKGFEYSHHFAAGIFPGDYYRSEELPGHGAKIFFTLYFFMTGLHALHMIGGISVIGWLARRVKKGRTTQGYHAELEMGGLYWHLVDGIWIFLWPLFYLTG
ncbi:MAG TPA: cytochrome c oxidase subunit 3 family protein [Kofleriaceae bacterium]|nr:cytochrome c oxidase subunit 3 family protein [Kofleriaceae bacterium]